MGVDVGGALDRHDLEPRLGRGAGGGHAGKTHADHNDVSVVGLGNLVVRNGFGSLEERGELRAGGFALGRLGGLIGQGRRDARSGRSPGGERRTGNKRAAAEC